MLALWRTYGEMGASPLTSFVELTTVPHHRTSPPYLTTVPHHRTSRRGQYTQQQGRSKTALGSTCMAVIYMAVHVWQYNGSKPTSSRRTPPTPNRRCVQDTQQHTNCVHY